MIDTQTLAEINNLRIRIDERDGKIVRQSSFITKLEQSRVDLRKANEALLRVARAAKELSLCGEWKQFGEVATYPGACDELMEALKEVEHLL